MRNWAAVPTIERDVEYSMFTKRRNDYWAVRVPRTVTTTQMENGQLEMTTHLTIGMAHHSDFDGVYFTTQAIRLYHPEVLDRIELVVIDNSPTTPSAGTIRDLVENRMRASLWGAKYVPFQSNGGPALSKEEVFRHATGDAVLVMDCHILLEPGSLKRLLDYYDANPECDDLLSGPLLTDTGSHWTHFDNRWRGHMWGTWGTARRCGGCGMLFSAIDDGEHIGYRLLEGDGSQSVTDCHCGHLPQIPWAGHEKILTEAGYLPAALEDEPFEIPAQGMGLFSCRKDAWLGFNPDFRGFGGEEFYIHTKFRQAGRKNVCLPFLRWLHRFARPGGVRYPLRVEDKVRNYVLGHQELGLDLTPVYEHFVKYEDNQNKPISEETWKALVADPVEYGSGIAHAGGGCGSCKKTIEPFDLEQAFAYYQKSTADVGEHFAKLRELAAKCEHVTDLSTNDGCCIALLAGKPKTLRGYNTKTDGAGFWKAEQLGKKLGIKVLISHEPLDSIVIDETDMLFYDPPYHSAKELLADLERHAGRVRRFIVVHDTEVFGVKGADGSPGLKLGLIHFMHRHREWSVVHNATHQHGLMVLSRNQEDKPPRPSIVKMGPTFLKHLSEHIVDGVKNVSQEQLEKRLEVCWLCDMRTHEEQCGLCGCSLIAKAKWRSSRCDANKWAEVDASLQ